MFRRRAGRIGALWARPTGKHCAPLPSARFHVAQMGQEISRMFPRGTDFKMFGMFPRRARGTKCFLVGLPVRRGNVFRVADVETFSGGVARERRGNIFRPRDVETFSHRLDVET